MYFRSKYGAKSHEAYKIPRSMLSDFGEPLRVDDENEDENYDCGIAEKDSFELDKMPW